MKVNTHFQEKNCVKIEVIDELISKIELHPRRYWKQALKRIETNNLILNYSFNQTSHEAKELSYLFDHYYNRKINKNNYSSSKQFLLKSYKFLHTITGNKSDMVSLYLTNNTETFDAKCLLNNQIAAYILCTLRGETLYLLRISINDSLGMYRPGILLIV